MNSTPSIYKNNFVQCSVTVDEHRILTISGNVNNPLSYKFMRIFSASPMNNMTNYAGSGLPYPCPQFAFEGTPNSEVINADGSFNVEFIYPNSYYTTDGLTKVPPAIFFTLVPKNGEEINVRFDLADELPLRTLTYRTNFRHGPQFYAAKEELIGIRSAEATMYYLKDYKSRYNIA